MIVNDPKIKSRSKLTVLAAASGEEITGTLPDQGHGIFTYYLLKGLRGDADTDTDSHLTLSELHAYLQRKVSDAARRQNREQHPQLKSNHPTLRLY